MVPFLDLAAKYKTLRHDNPLYLVCKRHRLQDHSDNLPVVDESKLEVAEGKDEGVRLQVRHEAWERKVHLYLYLYLRLHLHHLRHLHLYLRHLLEVAAMFLLEAAGATMSLHIS
jgi:hypothetical protein